MADPSKQIVTVRLSRATVTAIDSLASERAWSRSTWLTRAVERVLAAELARQPESTDAAGSKR